MKEKVIKKNRAKRQLTESQFSLLESARRAKFSFLKEWKIDPLKNSVSPVIVIEYPFDMHENDLVEVIEVIRKKYGIHSPRLKKPVSQLRENKPYYRAVQLRDRWIIVTYRLLKSLNAEKIYDLLYKQLKDAKKINLFGCPLKKSSKAWKSFYGLRIKTIKRIITATPKTLKEPYFIEDASPNEIDAAIGRFQPV